jgi:xylan 1,4-beta-xylosidase
VTDSAFMGPWLANNIRECDGLTSMMSYWSFSDVFEEQGIVKTPFYGGYGIMAERHIPKAAFHVFQILHELGDRRLPSQSENALVTQRADGTVIVALWNYAEPGEAVAPKTFRIQVNGVRLSRYRGWIVDPDHGSGLKVWKSMGSPISPTPAQAAEIARRSEVGRASEADLSSPLVLSPQALAVIELLR